MSRTPHRTPLRRISQGSLFALSRSQTYPDAPHGLGFLEPAMAELADETEALQANVEGLRALSDSIGAFNESFASWLYVLDMNALTTDWRQAPTDASFHLARRRAEEDAQATLAALRAPKAPVPDAETTANRTAVAERTEDADQTVATDNATPPAGSKPTVAKSKKKGVKPKMTAKEKKERNAAIDKAVNGLPLEFRGSDPNLRRHVEMVIEALMDNEGKGIKLLEMVKPPDLTQARVNKCLIALVNKKIVQKDNSTGTVLYHWQGLAS